MGRDAAEQPESDLAAGAAHDLAGQAPPGETASRRVPRRRAPHQEGNEALRGTLGTLQDAPQIRHPHQAQDASTAGKLRPADRLTAATVSRTRPATAC